MDGLPTKVLKEAFVVISRQLTYMFNKSLEKGIVPEKWKLSTIIPIPKECYKFEANILVTLTGKDVRKDYSQPHK